MIAYVDASVILRFILHQTPTLQEWPQLQPAITSRLTRVECLRTIQRIHLTGSSDDAEAAAQIAAIEELLTRFEVVAISDVILDRAAGSFGSVVGTLDAIHLATALLYRGAHGGE